MMTSPAFGLHFSEIMKYGNLILPFVCIALGLLSNCTALAQIVYNWQNSKEGWVSAGESNLGCTLTATPEAMGMRAFNETPVMRSGTLQSDLGIDASDYNQVEISLRNPSASNNPNARLFVYPPGTNTAVCHFNFQVDTGMTEYGTYIIDLESIPTSGVYDGPVGRFGLRGPWGVANGDTIWWETMIISNTNDTGSIDTTGMHVPLFDVSLDVHPNPVADLLEIKLDAVIETALLSDLTGRTVRSVFPGKAAFQMDVADLPEQVYLLHLEHNGTWEKRRVVVSRH